MELATLGAQVAAADIDSYVLVLALGFGEQAWRLEGIRSRSCSAVQPEVVTAAAAE